MASGFVYLLVSLAACHALSTEDTFTPRSNSLNQLAFHLRPAGLFKASVVPHIRQPFKGAPTVGARISAHRLAPHQIRSRDVSLLQGQGGNQFDRARSQLGGLLFPTVIFLLWISGQFKWLFDIVNGVFLLAFITPVIAFFGFNLWYKANVLEGACPNCGSRVLVPKSTAGACGVCGTVLIVEDGKIGRATVYNTQQMFGKKISTQNTTKLYMTPAIESAVNPSARSFQAQQQDVNRTVSMRFGGRAQMGFPL